MALSVSRRSLLKASLAAMGAMALGACGSTPTPAVVKETVVVEKEVTAAPAAEEKAAVIVYECCWNQDHIDAGKALYQTFRDNNPNIDVQDFWPLPDQSWTDTLLAKTAANEQIDVIWWCASHHKFAQEGRLLDLTPLLEADQNYKLDGVFQAAGIDFAYDLPGRQGPLWGVPTNYATVLLWYNMAMFDAAGLAYPTADWTYDDLLTNAKALTKDVDGDGTNDEWGIGLSGDGDWYYEPVIEAFGGGIVEVDGDGCLLSKPESVEALQWMQDLMHVHKVQPLPENSAAMGVDAMFISNKLGMIIRPEWAQFNFLPPHETDGLTYGVQLMPTGKAGRVTNYWAGITSVTSMAKAPKAAWEVAKFITSDAYQRTMTVFIPESPAARIETTRYRFEDHDTYPDDRTALTESPKYGKQYYAIARYGKEMQDIVTPALDPMWLGQAKPAEVVDGICEQVNAKIAELRAG
jgi:multiple sugar transport system substrate-binding protein